MSKNYLSLLILATLSLLSANTFAQDGLTFGNGKTYLLEELKVTGVVTYNEQTIITYTGLIPGQPITIPGVKLSDITKRLWGLGLFSNVK